MAKTATKIIPSQKSDTTKKTTTRKKARSREINQVEKSIPNQSPSSTPAGALEQEDAPDSEAAEAT